MLFVIILIANFIAVSIQDKAKEIGILRTMGTGRRYIYRIFIMEGILIACVTTITGTILTAIASKIANQMIKQEFLTRIVVGEFGIR